MRTFSNDDKIQPTIMTDADKILVIGALAKFIKTYEDELGNKNKHGDEDRYSQYMYSILGGLLINTIPGDYYIMNDINYNIPESICDSVLMPAVKVCHRNVSDTTQYNSKEYTGVVIIDSELNYRSYITLREAARYCREHLPSIEFPTNLPSNQYVGDIDININVTKMQKVLSDMLQNSDDPRYWHNKDEAREYCVNKMIISRDRYDIPICNHCHTLLAFDLKELTSELLDSEKVPIYCPNCDEVHYANLKIHGEINPHVCDICIYEKPATPAN